MDMITLAMAKAYSDSKGGYTEPGAVITFDGDTTGKIFANNMVKISDEKYDIRRITKLIEVDVFSIDGNTTGSERYERDVDGCRFVQDGESMMLFDDDAGHMLVGYLAPGNTTFGNIPSGLYAFCGETKPALESGQVRIVRFVSQIEFAETIVPINPKYLPGVTINLVDYGINPYALLASGNSPGKLELTNMAEFWAKIPMNGDRLVLVTDDGVNPVIYTQSAVVVVSGIPQVTFSAAMYNGTLVNVNLFILKTGETITTVIYTFEVVEIGL